MRKKGRENLDLELLTIKTGLNMDKGVLKYIKVARGKKLFSPTLFAKSKCSSH